MAGTGVLLTTFGGPRRLEDVPAFMRSVLGADASEDRIEEASIRYLTVGGMSPVPFTAERIASALERRLSGLPEPEEPEETTGFGLVITPSTRAGQGVRFPVVVGALHGGPSIEESVESLVGRDVDTILWAPLSPLDRPEDTRACHAALDAGVARHPGLKVREVASRNLQRALVMQGVEACEAALGELPPGPRVVVFVARGVALDDPAAQDYVHRCQRTAEAVATAALFGEATSSGPSGLGDLVLFGGTDQDMTWVLAYVAGEGDEREAVHPSLDEIIDAAAGTYTGICVCPIGFATEDTATLYGIDVVSTERALEEELELARAQIAGDLSAQVDALEEVVRPLL